MYCLFYMEINHITDHLIDFSCVHVCDVCISFFTFNCWMGRIMCNILVILDLLIRNLDAKHTLTIDQSVKVIFIVIFAPSLPPDSKQNQEFMQNQLEKSVYIFTYSIIRFYHYVYHNYYALLRVPELVCIINYTKN